MIYKGEVVETELSENSMGGTEMMRKRLLNNVQKELLEGYAIHFSRPRDIPKDVKNIMYCHDLAEDPENQVLLDNGWKQFDHFVFVSFFSHFLSNQFNFSTFCNFIEFLLHPFPFYIVIVLFLDIFFRIFGDFNR
jgi:hypothetical protein